MKKIKIKKILRVIIIVFISMVGVFSYSNSLINSKLNSDIKNPSEYSSMIILGAGIWGDRVSPQLKLRLDTAIELIDDLLQL